MQRYSTQSALRGHRTACSSSELLRDQRRGVGKAFWFDGSSSVLEGHVSEGVGGDDMKVHVGDFEAGNDQR